MKMKRFVLPAIYILAAALRITQAGASPYWYDEAYTVMVSRLPLGQLFAALYGDVHPPLYYVITWLISHTMGDSEIVMRMPSALLSLASVWLTGRLGRALGWDAAAVLAGQGIMAISPFQLFFAGEARMYALLQALLMVAALGVIERRWWLAGLGALGALYTHNYALIYLPVIGMVGLPCALRGKSFLRLAASLGLPVLGWLPWGSVLLGQMGTVSGGYWISRPTAGGVAEILYYLFLGFSQSTWMFTAATVALFGAFTVMIWRLAAVRPSGWVATLTIGLLPLALAVAASFAWKPVLLFRGLIASTPALSLVMGWWLSRMRSSHKITAALMLLTASVLAVVNLYTSNPKNNLSNTEALGLVRAGYQPGDVMIHANSGSMPSWAVYAPEIPQYRLPNCGEFEAWGSLSQATQAAIGITTLTLDQAPGRVWFVASVGPMHHACYGPAIEAATANAGPVKLLADDSLNLAGVWLIP